MACIGNVQISCGVERQSSGAQQRTVGIGVTARPHKECRLRAVWVDTPDPICRYRCVYIARRADRYSHEVEERLTDVTRKRADHSRRGYAAYREVRRVAHIDVAVGVDRNADGLLKPRFDA